MIGKQIVSFLRNEGRHNRAVFSHDENIYNTEFCDTCTQQEHRVTRLNFFDDNSEQIKFFFFFKNFFQASLRNCKNCDHNCEDHSSFDFISAVHI